MQFKRLARALMREGVEITQEGPVYRVRRASHDGPAAEVLLPEGYPLETKAVKQLAAFASVEHPAGGRVCAACATPDFHPGNVVPVGAVVATSDMVIPQAIGTDINCGMRLDLVDLTLDQFLSRKAELVELLRGDLLLGTRDLPLTSRTLRAIYEHGAEGWLEEAARRPMGLLARTHFGRLGAEAKADIWHRGSFEADVRWVEDRVGDGRDVVRDPDLGTVGGGNHFVEVQVVEEVLDYGALAGWGWVNMRPGQLAFMTHTGSRAVGKGVGTRWTEIARERWPRGRRWPEVFSLHGDDAREYMRAMGCAANFAAVNRVLLAEIVRDRVRQVHGDVGASCFYDVPHNLVTEEDGLFVHRKGATPAHDGQPVLVPGSMGHPSYVMCGLGSERFLRSASHGAGRARTRFEMGRRGRPDMDLGLDGVECVTLREERRIEEAPAAYKDVADVVDVQVREGLVSPVARLRPLLTFKA